MQKEDKFSDRRFNNELRQYGLSLIELLITLLISSFFILGLLTLYTNNIQTAKITKKLGLSAEGGGFGSMYLSRYLRMTGQNNYAHTTDFYNVINKVIVDLSANNQGTGGVYDRIAIEYEAPNMATVADTFRTCGGLDATAGEHIQEEFYVNADKKLSCDSTSLDSGATSTLALIQGVEMFQVEYGLSQNDYGRDTSRYVNIAAVGTQEMMNDRVRSVRFQLLVNVDSENTPERRDTDFSLYDANLTVDADGGYRVYGTTIAINNALRGRIIQ